MNHIRRSRRKRRGTSDCANHGYSDSFLGSTSEGEPPMQKQIVTTQSAPKAIGPYEQAIKVGDFIYVSGQIPLDPATGNLVEGNITAQTRRVMENLSAVLSAAGSSFERVVKT